MEQKVIDKTEKNGSGLNEKTYPTVICLEIGMTLLYLIGVIHFILIPLLQFMETYENHILNNIQNYLMN